MQMNIDPYYQRQNVGQRSQFLLKYGLCGYSRGFAGEGASNEGGVVFLAILDEYVTISPKRCILDTKLL